MGERAGQPALSARSSPSAVLRLAPDRAPTAPLSPALPLTLGGAAGSLLAIGGLGTWIRESTAAGGADLAAVDAVVGRSEAGGWALLVLGTLAVAASAGWVTRRKDLRRAAAWAAVAVAAAATWAVVMIDRRAAALASSAAGDPSFDAYHAGFGWGAWLLLIAGIAAALALLSGWLRGIDAGDRS